MKGFTGDTMKIFLNRHFFLTSLALVIFLLAGCAGSRHHFDHGRQVKPDPRALDLYVDGTIFEITQNIPAALLSYQEALLYDSLSSDIYRAIAASYLRLGKFESALRTINSCLNLYPEDIESLKIKVQIYANRRQWSLVEKTYLDILSIDKDNEDIAYKLAYFYLQQKENAKSLAVFEKMAARRNKPDPQILINLGELYIETEQYYNAISTYKNLISLDPEESYGYYGLGFAREFTGDTLGAVQSYKKAYRISPDFTQARDRLYDIYMSRGVWDEAINILYDAVETDSTDMTSWLQLGEIYWEKQDTVKTMQTQKEIMRRFPEAWQGFFNTGRFYLDMQKNKEAAQVFRKATTLSSSTPWGWLYLGIALAHQDSLESSLTNLLSAREIVPDDPLTNFYLGTVYSRLNRSSEAIEPLERALEKRPRWMTAISTLAEAHVTLKNYIKADSLFELALQWEPENALILNNYGFTLSERGERLEKAIVMAEKALELDPENGAYLDTIGWIYFKMGQYQKSLEYIEKACNKRPDSAVVLEHMGDVYFKLGNSDKARKFWEKAYELDQDNTDLLEKLKPLTAE